MQFMMTADDGKDIKSTHISCTKVFRLAYKQLLSSMTRTDLTIMHTVERILGGFI